MVRVRYGVIGLVCGRNESQLTCGALRSPTTPALLSASGGDFRVHRGQMEEQEGLRDGGVSRPSEEKKQSRLSRD